MRLKTKKYIGNNEFRLETKFLDGKQLIEGKIIQIEIIHWKHVDWKRLFEDWKKTLETMQIGNIKLDWNQNVHWKHCYEVVNKKCRLET